VEFAEYAYTALVGRWRNTSRFASDEEFSLDVLESFALVGVDVGVEDRSPKVFLTCEERDDQKHKKGGESSGEEQGRNQPTARMNM